MSDMARIKNQSQASTKHRVDVMRRVLYQLHVISAVARHV